MKSHPKVSVIIPNYNHGEYLRQRISTVLDQSYTNFEVIVLDDCSTDNSRQVISSYEKDPRIKKILQNERNSGSPFNQWETGLKYASGSWIWFAESDDYADTTFLEKLILSIDNRSNIGLIYCDSMVVDGDVETGKTFSSMKNVRFSTSRWSQDYFNDGINEIENFLLPGGTVNNSSAVLFNRDILVSINPFDLNLKYIGDKFAFIKTLSVSDVVYVSDCLNYYRNPFNKKHADKYIYYCYEQFLVYNWVYNNLKIKDWRTFYKGFHENTQNSLRKWNATKIKLYKRMFNANPILMLRSICNNFIISVQTLF